MATTDQVDYVTWVTVDDEQWDDETFATAQERDARAKELAIEMRDAHPDRQWRVWVGESTPARAITPETSRLYARGR